MDREGGGGGSRAGGLRHGGSTRKRLGAGHGVRNGVHGSVLLVETLKPPAPRFQAPAPGYGAGGGCGTGSDE